MKITSVRMENWLSFADSGLVELSDINVLTGPTNSGKSAFIHAVQLMQAGSDPPSSSIRLQAPSSQITYNLTSNDLVHDLVRCFQFSAGSVSQADSFQLDVTLNRNDQGGFAIPNRKLTIQGIDTAQYSPPQVPAEEPNNFLYTYFSKRKVPFDQQVDEKRTRAITPDLRNLPSKVFRLSNPTYEGHEEFTRLCDDVLGFRIGTYAAESGQRVGISVGRHDHIPVEAMGEGVSSMLGLIVDLCMADGNLFLIEEPENDIHPQGLKTLLRVITEKAGPNQFIISTHSNVVLKNLGADSRLFSLQLDFAPNSVPTSTMTPEENTPSARIAVLRQLGYELYDSDFYEGWLFLEESSAQTIIRNYLIPWFAPRLARIQTVAVNGITKMEPTFEDFRRLFLFAHLETQYNGRAWVVVDGDDIGKTTTQQLQAKYKTWDGSHFRTWSETDFERYYPERFQQAAAAALALPHDKKRPEKAKLLDEVKQWCDANEEEAKVSLQKSASEVIEFLKEIDQKLFA